MMARKLKRPRLVVDNKPSEPDEFSYEEFLPIANRIIDLHKRYPEIDVMRRRAFDHNDYAMRGALLEMTLSYFAHINQRAEMNAKRRRRKLKVVKKKPQP